MASQPGRVNPSPKLRREIFLRDEMVCQYCANREALEYEIDHIVPVSLGGPTKAYNLVTACERCNTVKRSAVWAPINLEVITADHPGWCQHVLALATPPGFSLSLPGDKDPNFDYPRRLRKMAAHYKVPVMELITYMVAHFLANYDDPEDPAEDAAELGDHLTRWIEAGQPKEVVPLPSLEDGAYAA